METTNDITSPDVPVKRRGRPKGVKNKSKVPVQSPQPVDVTSSTPAVDTQKPIVGLKSSAKKSVKPNVKIDPEWVLTKTSGSRTPIAIVSIMSHDNKHEFLIIPRPQLGGTSKTTIKSTSVIRPVFTSPEQEKEFDGIEFWTPPTESEKTYDEQETENVVKGT